MGESQQACAEQGEHGAAYCPMERKLVRMRQAGAANSGVGIHRYDNRRYRLECAEHAADRKPVTRHADPVIVMRGAEDASDKDQADNDLQPFFHHLAIGAPQAYQ